MRHLYRGIAFVTLMAGFIAGLTHMDKWVGLIPACGALLFGLIVWCLVDEDTR